MLVDDLKLATEECHREIRRAIRWQYWFLFFTSRKL